MGSYMKWNRIFIAITQSHAAYAALTHGLSSRWTYLAMQDHSKRHNLFKPLEDVIRQRFLLSLTG